MAITHQVTVEKARVDYTDALEVELTQERRRTRFTPEQAEELAEELLRNAAFVRVMQAEDAEERRQRVLDAQLITDTDHITINGNERAL